MKRKFNGFVPEDDRTVSTFELTRAELMILYDGIRRHRIKETRLKLNALKMRRCRQRTATR